MPDDIISQYRRTYNSPIETYRQVATPTDRDNIPSGVRWRGMLVHVIADNVTYELVGGIGNGDWQLMGGLQDAPIDGQTYGRKDGNWEIIDAGGVESVVPGTNIAVTTTDPANPVVNMNVTQAIAMSPASYAQLATRGNFIYHTSGNFMFVPQSNLGSGLAASFNFLSISGTSKEYTFPNASGTVALQTAASGSFTTSDSKTVTVVNGIITSIV